MLISNSPSVPAWKCQSSTQYCWGHRCFLPIVLILTWPWINLDNTVSPWDGGKLAIGSGAMLRVFQWGRMFWTSLLATYALNVKCNPPGLCSSPWSPVVDAVLGASRRQPHWKKRIYFCSVSWDPSTGLIWSPTLLLGPHRCEQAASYSYHHDFELPAAVSSLAWWSVSSQAQRQKKPFLPHLLLLGSWLQW